MAAHNHMTLAERVMREFQAKQRLLTSRPDVPIEPAELRELMAAADQALAELADIKQRCLHDEDAAKTKHRASSPLVGRGGGVRRRAMRRAEANQFRATTSSIDRSITDLRKLQASLRPAEIDLREQPPRRHLSSNTHHAGSLPPPPARLGTNEATPTRPPTEHERALLTWLAEALHEVLTNRDRPEWPALSQHLIESYGPPPADLASPYAGLQRHLLDAADAVGQFDGRTAIDELTLSYAVLKAQDGAQVTHP